MNEDLIQKFGFSEMYEWSEIPAQEYKLGRFVQFDSEHPGKIKLCADFKNIVGVTTINSVLDSDNPTEWHGKNLANEYGDVYLRKERLAVGGKQYDQNEEMAFIKTWAWEHLIPITNKSFNPEAKYVKRSNRQEWVRVNLLGKCVVEDDGKCVPGEYCTLYKGKVKAKQGTVKPATDKSEIKFYVILKVHTSENCNFINYFINYLDKFIIIHKNCINYLHKLKNKLVQTNFTRIW